MKKSLLFVAIALAIGSSLLLTNRADAVKPSDYGLKEGDVISAEGDPDVYIVNDYGFKRLFVNPEIFNLYGHLGWDKIKKVTPEVRDAFITSGLFRNCEATGTVGERVYGLDVVNEDIANLRWVNTTGSQAVIDDFDFFKKVFCINTKEVALYGIGTQYTSVLQIPAYSRGGTVGTPMPVSIPLDYNLLSQMTVKIKCVAGWGSGTMISRDASSAIVFTNKHVTDGSSSCTIYYGTSPEVPPANFVIGSVQQHPSSNPLADFSILTVQSPPSNIPYLLQKYRFCNKDEVKIALKVSFLGYPGIGTAPQEQATITTTTGIVSGFYFDSQMIKSDAAIDHGNSGGLAILDNGCYLGLPSSSFYKANELASLLGLTQLAGIVPIYDVYNWSTRQFISLPTPSTVYVPTPTPTPVPSTNPTPTPSTTPTPAPTQVGTITANKYTGYADQNISIPKTNVKIGHFSVTAGSGEDISVNTVSVAINNSGGDFTPSDLTDTYIKIWSDSGSLVYTSTIKSTLADNNSYSVNFTLPKSKTYQIEVWSNVGSSITSGNWINLNLSANGTTAGSSTSVNSGPVTGQKITVQVGSLAKANGAVPATRLVNGGTTITGYAFTLTPSYDDYTLDEVYVSLSSIDAPSLGAVANISLKDGGTVIGTAVLDGAGAASFTGLNLPLLQSAGTKTLTVDVLLTNVGVGANATAGLVKIRLNGLKYRNSAGSITTATDYDTNIFTGNANYVVKGYPTFANVALPSTVLAAGTQTLFKTSVTATGGQISWNDIVFTVASSSAAGTVDDTSWRLFENGVDTGATASSNDGTTSQRVEFAFATERVVSAGSSVTLELKVTVGGTLAAGENISTQIANPTGTTVTVSSSAAQKGSGASFVWSDQSSAGHSSSTSDWFTDGLVKTLAQAHSLSK